MDKLFKILVIMWLTYYAVKVNYQIEILEEPVIEAFFSIITIVIIIKVINSFTKKRNRKE